MSVRARYLSIIIVLVISVASTLAYFQCSRLTNAQLKHSFANGQNVAASLFDLSQRAIYANPQKSAKDTIRDDLSVKAWMEASARSNSFSYLAILATDKSVIAEYDPAQLRLKSPSLGGDALLKRRWLSQVSELSKSGSIVEAETPLSINQQPFGSVVVGIPGESIYSTLAPGLRLTMIVAFSASALALLLAVFLSGLVLRPLQEFVGIIEQLEAESLPPAGRDPVTPGPQNTAQRLRELGRRFAGNRTEMETLRDQMRQVVNNLPDRLLLLDRDQRVMMASPQLETLLFKGAGAKHELRGTAIQDILVETHPVRVLIQNAFSSGKSQEASIEILNQEDFLQSIVASVQIFEENGVVNGALVTLRDLESLRQLETQLDYAARLAALSRITSGVAHEVKNPLHAMVLHLELLRAKLDGGRDPSTHVEVLTSEVNRLNRVVQTFLDFTRPVQMQNRRYDLNEIVREVALLAPEKPEAGIQLVTNCSSSPLFIDADVDLLKQALLNIVINAYQAMPDGGIVMVTTSKTGKAAEIVITDQGTGIPLELQEKIFNLYFTTKENGSGIGLAQAFRAVQLSNGNIEVHSEVGKGTSFKITLQLK